MDPGALYMQRDERIHQLRAWRAHSVRRRHLLGHPLPGHSDLPGCLVDHVQLGSRTRCRLLCNLRYERGRILIAEPAGEQRELLEPHQQHSYYQTVWTAQRSGDIVLIKTLLYTGVRVAELVKIRIADVDLDACRIRITQGKGGKDRYVPFPAAFKETLALHIDTAHRKGAVFLFESSWKKPYSTRGVRAMLARYAAQAGLEHNMSPHRLRHFLFTWLKTQGVDDALIQPYSGRTSLEIYSKIALGPAQDTYDQVIDKFPV